ncbi:penicillin acylase family protein [Xenorhabdus bovienii]|uniref:penicillin acylase family protein n=1 Tax=Xenorhabdus bovienii TaxID=40576 RepID=UPI00237C85DB|nr:penicillin acylase family protein [Xenorhabdus bovienii]MDE1494188.1 penicillin acylase family protein [Xenorhabdus bovienii]
MKIISCLFSRFPISSRFICGVVIPILILFLCGYLYLRQSLPSVNGQIFVKGLHKNVTIERDKYGIPHIKASTDTDAFFALGYVHAQDRLWQMEVNRRLSSGRLSEIIGEKAITLDKYAKILGFSRNADKAWQQLGEREKKALQAYVDGINQWISSETLLPSEFLIFQYKPEPWTVIDSLSWMQLMAWNLGRNYNEELRRLAIANEFGSEALHRFELVSISDDQEKLQSLSQSHDVTILASLQRQFASVANLDGQQIGSNNWVVSGKYTQSGKPLLSSDPHFQTSSPVLLYLASIQGDKINATGSTFPGLPFIAIGRNQSIAWGTTNMVADVQDVAILKTLPVDTDLYEIDGSYQRMEKHKETINIRNNVLKKSIPPITFYARSTLYGPVISDATNGLTKNQYSIQWVGQQGIAASFTSLLNLNYASNWDEFLQSFEKYEAPAQNYIYADIEGNIGFISPGKIPIRNTGDGSLPVAGWQSKYKWNRFIPFKELPQEFNPARGYITTANNDVTPEGYPYNITHDWEPSYRVNRISSLLESLLNKGHIKIEDMVKIQSDTTDLHTQKVLPLLLKLTANSDRQQQALEYLHHWDSNYSDDSVAATIYQSWIASFYRMMIENSLAQYSGNRSATSLLTKNFKPDLLLRMLKQPDTYCRQPNRKDTEIQDCKNMLSISLDNALDELSTIIGSNMKAWKWGEIHIAHYPHFPFSSPKYSKLIPPTIDNPLSFIYHRKINSSGSQFSINVAPPDFNNQETPFIQLIGAAYRQINDLNDKKQDVFILSTGQSGNVLSQHYDDQMKMYKNMEYISMFNEKPVATLILTPVEK